MGGVRVAIRVLGCKSYGRISNIIVESLFIDQKRGWGRISKSRRGVRHPKISHLPYTFISGSNRDGDKIRALHSVQNTLINQQRTSQMMRCSPTAFDDGYMVLPITWQIISSFQNQGNLYFLLFKCQNSVPFRSTKKTGTSVEPGGNGTRGVCLCEKAHKRASTRVEQSCAVI